MAQIMTWEEIRKAFPDTFVLLDHFAEKKIADHKFVVESGEVVFTTQDGKKIFDEYRLRGLSPSLVFGHTTQPTLEFEEIPFFGARPAP